MASVTDPERYTSASPENEGRSAFTVSYREAQRQRMELVYSI